MTYPTAEQRSLIYAAAIFEATANPWSDETVLAGHGAEASAPPYPRRPDVWPVWLEMERIRKGEDSHDQQEIGA